MIDQTPLNIIHISSHGELNDNSIDDEAITASYLEDLNLEASSVVVSGEFPSVAPDEMLDVLRTKKQLIILDACYSGVYWDTTILHQEFEKLVLRYQNYLHLLAFRILGNWQAAEDVTQEAWIRAFRYLKRQCDGGQAIDMSRIRGLLGVIVRNTAKTYYEQDRKHHCVSLEAGDRSEFAELTGIVADKFEQPEQLLLWNENRWTLQELINTLPLHYRMVIFLRFCQDMSYEEIATLLHRPIGTIKCYQNRGIQRLRKKVKEQKITLDDLNIWSDYSRYDGMLWNYVIRYQQTEMIA